MLEANNLCFDYPDKPLLQQVQFVLEPGRLLHLKGGNGTGKTTLLKLLAGIFEPQQGEICYEGLPITQNIRNYQQNICFIGHKAGVNALLTVKENCALDVHWGKCSIPVMDLLSDFGLAALANEPCSHLSAGQRHRLSLLRIVMTGAKLWLLDEPFVALDTKAMQSLDYYFEQHLMQGGQIILTSHQSLNIKQGYQEYSL